MQIYYYNARTRESAWSKPDNAKIITQAEMEAMVASGQPLPGSTPAVNRPGSTSQAPAAQSMIITVSLQFIKQLIALGVHIFSCECTFAAFGFA